LIAGVLVLAVLLGFGTWTVASRSTSTDDLAGASSNGRFGSTITIRNDGPYLLKVTDLKNGTGTVTLPSCTVDTYWPKNASQGWLASFQDVTGRAGFNDTVADKEVANATTCTHTWTYSKKLQTTDLELQVEVCMPRVKPAGADRGKTGCDPGGASSAGFGTQKAVFKARSSDLGVHAIWMGNSTIDNNFVGKTETWDLDPGGFFYGMRANVVASAHEKYKVTRGDYSPFVYTINTFKTSRCIEDPNFPSVGGASGGEYDCSI